MSKSAAERAKASVAAIKQAQEAKQKKPTVSLEKTEKRLNVNLPESQYLALRQKAMGEGRTVTGLIKIWVEQYLNE